MKTATAPRTIREKSATPGKPVNAQAYNQSLIPRERATGKSLDKLPQHDTMWDMCMAPDDTLYIGACVEHTAGMSAWLCSYHHKTDRIEYLADLAQVTGEPNDSGHATQGKIHFSLCCGADGRVYGATHCTTAPKGDRIWSPFTMYTDPIRCYPGAHLFVHDPRTRETRSLGILIPYEGIRVMVIDAERNLLHGTTYPKCHYFTYDLTKKKLTDLGRFACVHQLALFLDDEGNGYTTDNFGRLFRYEIDARQFRSMDVQLPHASFRRGEHNILFQVARQPGTGVIYGASYAIDARLFRYDPRTNEMADLGMAYGCVENPEALQAPYPGGLTFGQDGHLYYGVQEIRPNGDTRPGGHLIRYNPADGASEDLGILAPDGLAFSGRSCHGKTDSAGNLYFAQNSSVPPRFFIYHAGRK